MVTGRWVGGGWYRPGDGKMHLKFESTNACLEDGNVYFIESILILYSFKVCLNALISRTSFFWNCFFFFFEIFP